MTGKDMALEDWVMGPLTEAEAREVCTWRYPAPYEVYDYADWETVAAAGWHISLPDRREAEYVGFTGGNLLQAYGRITAMEDYALLGIGLRPANCGQGMGAAVMLRLTALAAQRHPALQPALEVRTFNIRAVRCYERCGFRILRRYVRNTHKGPASFYFMVLEG